MYAHDWPDGLPNFMLRVLQMNNLKASFTITVTSVCMFIVIMQREISCINNSVGLATIR